MPVDFRRIVPLRITYYLGGCPLRIQFRQRLLRILNDSILGIVLEAHMRRRPQERQRLRIAMLTNENQPMQ